MCLGMLVCIHVNVVISFPFVIITIIIINYHLCIFLLLSSLLFCEWDHLWWPFLIPRHLSASVATQPCSAHQDSLITLKLLYTVFAAISTPGLSLGIICAAISSE